MRLRDIVLMALMALHAPVLSAQGNIPAGTLVNAAGIRKFLIGKSISYNPPGWADTNMTEDFYPNGVWRGVLHGRGPMPFSGRWVITDRKICVTADEGTDFKKSHSGQYCREIWQDRKTGTLRTYYLWEEPSSLGGFGLQTLSVSHLALSK